MSEPWVTVSSFVEFEPLFKAPWLEAKASVFCLSACHLDCHLAFFVFSIVKQNFDS
jgi:hypothetical protein